MSFFFTSTPPGGEIDHPQECFEYIFQRSPPDGVYLGGVDQNSEIQTVAHTTTAACTIMDKIRAGTRQKRKKTSFRPKPRFKSLLFVIMQKNRTKNMGNIHSNPGGRCEELLPGRKFKLLPSKNDPPRGNQGFHDSRPERSWGEEETL